MFTFLGSVIDFVIDLPLQVSEELIRVAILWHEMWHEGLEEASRLYFGERNVKGMFAVLEPLHAMMERGPQTLKETSFNQVCNLLPKYTLMQKYGDSLYINRV